MSDPKTHAALEKRTDLPNAEEYLSEEQRWNAVAGILAGMVLRRMESEVDV